MRVCTTTLRKTEARLTLTRVCVRVRACVCVRVCVCVVGMGVGVGYGECVAFIAAYTGQAHVGTSVSASSGRLSAKQCCRLYGFQAVRAAATTPASQRDVVVTDSAWPVVRCCGSPAHLCTGKPWRSFIDPPPHHSFAGGRANTLAPELFRAPTFQTTKARCTEWGARARALGALSACLSRLRRTTMPPGASREGQTRCELDVRRGVPAGQGRGHGGRELAQTAHGSSLPASNLHHYPTHSTRWGRCACGESRRAGRGRTACATQPAA